MSLPDSKWDGARVEGRLGLTLEPELPASSTDGSPASIARLASELPDPSSLSPESWISITPGLIRPPSLWDKLARRPPRAIPLSLRCTALLLRGYHNIRADPDGRARGQVPPAED